MTATNILQYQCKPQSGLCVACAHARWRSCFQPRFSIAHAPVDFCGIIRSCMETFRWLQVALIKASTRYARQTCLRQAAKRCCAAEHARACLCDMAMHGVVPEACALAVGSLDDASLFNCRSPACCLSCTTLGASASVYRHRLSTNSCFNPYSSSACVMHSQAASALDAAVRFHDAAWSAQEVAKCWCISAVLPPWLSTGAQDALLQRHQRNVCGGRQCQMRSWQTQNLASRITVCSGVRFLRLLCSPAQTCWELCRTRGSGVERIRSCRR